MSDLYDLFIAISTHGPSGCAVKVAGAICVGNAASLQEALLDALVATPTSLIVDLGSVSSIDGTGLDVLVWAHMRATAAYPAAVSKLQRRGGPSHRTQRPSHHGRGQGVISPPP
jgi:hypothetical protein